MAVAVPSGIQVFSWLATIASAKGRFQLNTPSLFVLGMLFIFTVGGLTGVMVAMVPFDWQAHDTHFIVAHLHYVLVGGMVFPLFATFYYWAPMVSTRMLSERLGKWSFWLMFIGFNMTFLHMHITGLVGMPRRVWTYSEASGWGPYNFVSTVGAYIIGAGVLVFIIDVIRNFRVGQHGMSNPWQAGTLEWLPTDVYSTRSIPHVTSREPLWDQPNLSEQVEAGGYYLPNAPTGGRETIVTSPIEAKPQYVIQMLGPSWTHFFAAVFTAACFLLLTIKVVVPALVCAVLAIVSFLVWAWELDKGPDKGPVDIGGGFKLPVYMTGPAGHGWWAMVILMLVAGSLYFAYLFSYLYLWTVSPGVWPSDTASIPDLQWPVISALLFIAGAILFAAAKGALPEPGTKQLLTPLLVLLGALSSVLAVYLEIRCHWQTGLSPVQSSYGALVYTAGILNGQLVFAVLIMSLFVVARHVTGKLDRVRFASLENTNLLAYYTVAQALISLLVIHGFPRMI